MDFTTAAFLSVLMRFLHISSVVTIVGGMAYGRVAPSAIGGAFRNWLRWACLLVVVSGLYNFLTKKNLPPVYHMWFGLKMLGVLHIVVSTLLATRDGLADAKRSRMATSVMIAGFIVVLLSAYLRLLSTITL